MNGGECYARNLHYAPFPSHRGEGNAIAPDGAESNGIKPLHPILSISFVITFFNILHSVLIHVICESYYCKIKRMLQSEFYPQLLISDFTPEIAFGIGEIFS
jgi:hypothetical protein